MGRLVFILAWLSLSAALISSVSLVLVAHPLYYEFCSWGPFGLSVYFDIVATTMLLLVSFLTITVVSFSKNYLSGNPDQGRFFKWLSITAGSVLLLAVSGNLALFACAWMGVSLSLHKLLSFYGERDGARLAARKKFIFSRLGDVAFLVALGMVWHTFGTFDYKKLFAATAAMPLHGIELIPVLLVIAAIIKSAQFPFHGWLPETMEAPTPVSALMHAGIINAGGFLIIRLSPLIVLSPGAMVLLASIGGFTALFGSLVMVTQTSVKRGLAFSTIAQMGFMMFQCGLGAFALALFHILAHSLYKAYAFLYSGNVISEASRLGSAPKKKQLGFFSVLVVLATAGTLVFLVTRFLGIQLLENPTQFGLAFILGIALAQVLWYWGSLTRSWSAALAGLVAGSVMCALFFFIHTKIESLLGAILPSEFQFGLGWPTVLLTLLAFSILALRAFFCGAWSSTRLGQILFVHTYNGFYINILIHRLFAKLGLSSYAGETSAKLRDDRQVKNGEKIIPQKISSTKLNEAVEQAWKRIPPLWPLSRFVAVNPFVGFSETDFLSAASLLKKRTGTALAMPLSFYAERYRSGLITQEDLEKAAIEMLGENSSARSTIDALISRSERSESKEISTSTVALDLENGSKWESFITQEVSKWATAYFDKGETAWSFPWKNTSLFPAWKEAAAIDLNPEIAGVTGWQKYVRHLPGDPMEAIEEAVSKLSIPEEKLVDFFYTLLISINGWAGHLQFLAHEKKLLGEKPEMLSDLLAIRAAYEVAFQPTQFFSNPLDETSELPHQLLWQRAHEWAMQRRLFKKLSSQSTAAAKGGVAAELASSSFLQTQNKAPLFQAAFCIDVRSEVYRRSLESVAPEAQTIGFAGFFGFPIEFTRAGEKSGAPQCPVLLAPAAAVSECCAQGELRMIGVRKKIFRLWKFFKSSAVSSFVFVEIAGLGFFFTLLKALFHLPRTSSVATSCGDLNLEAISMKTQIALAEGALRHMGLAKIPLSKLVLLCGHGSTTENNPYASSLDCGACGGHSGEANARTAVAVLNNPEVRTALRKKDILIPEETYFIAGLHNTMTDIVTLFNKEEVCESHKKALEELSHYLAQATLLAQQERAISLGLDSKNPNLLMLLQNKSHDWSQVMPEWGLAGNYAFIAAPRARTRGTDLEGRVFLHDYSYLQDQEEATLGLILSAPVVVASWINLQYFASTVDNKRFGSGDKTIHNVAGLLGVLEGNEGDIRTGLPLQSVYDGKKWRHEPLRLHVCIEAPKEAIDRVLERHPAVADLVSHHWIYLFAISEEGTLFEKSNGRGAWSQQDIG